MQLFRINQIQNSSLNYIQHPKFFIRLYTRYFFIQLQNLCFNSFLNSSCVGWLGRQQSKQHSCLTCHPTISYINKDDGYTTADNECINANISTWMPEISRELHTKGFFGIVHLSVHWETRWQIAPLQLEQIYNAYVDTCNTHDVWIYNVFTMWYIECMENTK